MWGAIALGLTILTFSAGQRIFTSVPISIESSEYRFPGNSHGCGHIRSNSTSELTIDMSENSCGGGTYQPSSGSASCLACAAGSFSSPGAAICKSCQAGRYGAVSSLTICTLCSPGKYSGVVGNVACAVCPPGQEAPNMGQGLFSRSIPIDKYS